MCFFKTKKSFNSIFSPLLFCVVVFWDSSQHKIYSKSPLDESIGSIQSKALNGDAHYQGILSLYHKFGEKGLAVDIEESRRWATLSAEKEGAIGLCTLAALSLESGKINRGYFLYDEAYLHSNLLALAKSKDPVALYCLGMVEIDNPPRNFQKGIRHLELSAEKGFASAQATLGMIYFTGIGAKKDFAEAIKWCSRAATSKHPLGMFYLGMAYATGNGIEKNEDYALRWIRAAADRDLVVAQTTIGMKFATGDGVVKDLRTAIFWFEKAVELGSAEAKLQLRKYKNLFDRLKNPPAVYLAENQKNSVAEIANDTIRVIDSNQSIENQINPLGLENVSNIGNPNSFSDVDRAMSALVVENNPEKAKSLLESLALNGNTKAARQLGIIHYKDEDFIESKKWFEKGSLKNDIPSLRYLGILHFFGQGVKQSYQTADLWFSQAAKLGDKESSRYLKAVKQFY